jgi:undecaprenyl-diphosphatase
MKEPQLFFDVMLHLGTLAAVLIFFRADIREIVSGTVDTLKGIRKRQEQARLLLWIILATIPTGLIGILFKDWFESLFSNPQLAGFTIMITGLILWLTRFVKEPRKPLEKMGWLDAVVIGIAQGIAIIPGISRSGATISTGLFLGVDRELSGKFSFLLSVPAILGATLLEARKISTTGDLVPILAGTTAALVVGIFCLKFLMKIIKIGKVSVFSYYCWGMGILIIVLAG